MKNKEGVSLQINNRLCNKLNCFLSTVCTAKKYSSCWICINFSRSTSKSLLEFVKYTAAKKELLQLEKEGYSIIYTQEDLHIKLTRAYEKKK